MVNPQLRYLCLHLVPARHAGKGSPFVGRAQPFSLFFLLCQASLIRGLAGQSCCKGLFMPPHPPFLSPCSSFSAYNDGIQQRKNIHCTQDRYFLQDNLDESAERKACQFKRSWLGECSGLHDPNYGYSLGKPCILLRMNRVR